MTSEKLSRDNLAKYVSLQLDMVTHRIWLVALSALSFFLLYVLIPLIALVHTRNVLLMQENVYMKTEMLNRALSLYGIDAGWLPLFVAVLAVLFAFAGFSYLYRNNALDFYESQPFTRKTRFLMLLCNNLLIFTPILVISTGLGMVITLLTSGIRLIVYFEIILQAIRLFIVFFAVSGVASLAAVLSGNLVIAFMMMGFLTFIELFARILFSSCSDLYFTTVNTMFGQRGGWWGITSPFIYDLVNFTGKGYAYVYSPTSEQLAVYGKLIPCYLAMAVVGTAAFVAAYFAYKYRKHENTGRGLCYPFAESAVKIAIAVFVGVFAGMIVDISMESQYKNLSPIFLFVVVLFITLTCGIGEVIFAKSIHAVKKRAWQIPVCIAASFLILYSFKLDVFGYDAYVPNPVAVKSAALSFGQIFYDDNNEIQPLELSYTNNVDSGNVLKRMELTGEEIDALCEVAKIAMPKRREVAIRERNQYGMAAESYDIYDVSVVYRLTDGREVTRHMAIPYDIDEGLMNKIIGSAHYKEARNDFAGLREVIGDSNYMRKSTITLYYEYGGMQMNKTASVEEAERFLAAYRKDLDGYDYSFAKNNRSIGTVSMEILTRWNNSRDYYPDGFAIYPSFTNTIACMQELGIYHEPSFVRDEVDYFLLYRSDQKAGASEAVYERKTTEYNNSSNTVEYRKDEQIAELCTMFTPDTNSGDWFNGKEGDNIYIYACMNDIYKTSVYGRIPKELAPEYLKTDAFAEWE